MAIREMYYGMKGWQSIGNLKVETRNNRVGKVKVETDIWDLLE